MVTRRKFVAGALAAGGAVAAAPLVVLLTSPGDGSHARPIVFRIRHDPSVHVDMTTGEAFDVMVYKDGEMVEHFGKMTAAKFPKLESEYFTFRMVDVPGRPI